MGRFHTCDPNPHSQAGVSVLQEIFRCSANLRQPFGDGACFLVRRKTRERSPHRPNEAE